MSANLVIVESPAKAKTIKKYLGPDFEVLASYGHVRDLIEKEGAVNPDRNFEMKYQLIDKSKPKIDAIERAMKKAGALYLATDPDREGEAISWHLSEILNEHGALEGKDLKRVRFYEITKNAVRAAVEQAESGVNQNLVNAYKARRALDYLVGFNLSPLLWKKIKPGLSAGRVQSVALRLICEREAEIQKFLRQEYWTIEADASKESARFPARLTEFRGEKVEADTQKARFSITNEGDARERRAHDPRGRRMASLTVESVERRPKRRNPPPPFTTSTLQQEAARKLGFTARRTMQSAQKLYEAGFITYMRTDSVNLSVEAVREIRETIKANFGDKALSDGINEYKTKAKNAQEAHEAIRPTDASATPQKAEHDVHDADQRRLYALVWKRAIACQMAPAVFDTVAVDLVAGDPKAATGAARHVFRANGQTLLEPGFLAAYHEDHDEDETDVESEDEHAPAGARGRRACRARVDPARAALHAAAAALHRGEPRQVARGPRHRPAVDLRLDHRDAALSPLRRDERARLHPDRHRQDRQQVPGQVPRDLRRVRIHRADGGRARRDQQRREGVAEGTRAASGSRSASASTTSARRSRARKSPNPARSARTRSPASRSPCAWASTGRSCSRARATTSRSRASRASCPASTWTTSRSRTR